MPRDQVRNSGFGSNYPSSLSDPSITSITPLLISSMPCRLSWKRWRCRLSLGGDGIDIQSIRHFVKSWEYAAAIVSQDENFGLDFTQTDCCYLQRHCMHGIFHYRWQIVGNCCPARKKPWLHFPASCSPIIRFKSELQQFRAQMWAYYCFHHKEETGDGASVHSRILVYLQSMT